MATISLMNSTWLIPHQLTFPSMGALVFNMIMARRDKDESGCEEEEEVTVFDGETTVDVDVDVLSEDAVCNNEDNEQQDTDDNSSENEEEATLNAPWKDSQRLMDAIALLEQQRQKAAQKGESVVHSLQ
ncbi:unnamed protein product [Sphagnum balticum]